MKRKIALRMTWLCRGASGAVAVGAIGTGLVLSAIFGYSASAVAVAQGHSAPKPISKVLKDHFRVFRGVGQGSHAHPASSLPPSALPSGSVGRLINGFLGDSGAPPVSGGSLANVVQVGTATALGSVWLVPGEGGVCVATQLEGRAVGTCNTSASATASGIEGMLQNPSGGRLLFGLVPNGNTFVQVSTTSGVVRAPVSNNIFAVVLDSAPTSETFQNGSGAVTTVASPGS